MGYAAVKDHEDHLKIHTSENLTYINPRPLNNLSCDYEMSCHELHTQICLSL